MKIIKMGHYVSQLFSIFFLYLSKLNMQMDIVTKDFKKSLIVTNQFKFLMISSTITEYWNIFHLLNYDKLFDPWHQQNYYLSEVVNIG